MDKPNKDEAALHNATEQISNHGNMGNMGKLRNSVLNQYKKFAVCNTVPKPCLWRTNLGC